MFSNVEEALEGLGDEARAVFDGTVEGSWEYRPQCVDPYDATWYEWCDDCETFHQSWYVFGYEVSKDQVEVIVWCCDQDGNWDVVESAVVGTPEAEGLDVIYGGDGWQKSYVEYLKHVAETGTDPCGEFTPPPPNRRDEDWLIYVIERGEKVWVTRAETRGAIYERPDNLPEHVKEFLLLEKLGDVSACAIDPENVKGISDLGDDVKWSPGKNRGEWIIQVTITRHEPAMSDEEWSSKLREKANAARALMALRDS